MHPLIGSAVLPVTHALGRRYSYSVAIQIPIHIQNFDVPIPPLLFLLLYPTCSLARLRSMLTGYSRRVRSSPTTSATCVRVVGGRGMGGGEGGGGARGRASVSQICSAFWGRFTWYRPA